MATQGKECMVTIQQSTCEQARKATFGACHELLGSLYQGQTPFLNDWSRLKQDKLVV